MKKAAIFLLLLGSLSGVAQPAIREAAHAFNNRLGRGINFMATKINQGYHDPFDFNLVRENKFTHIRIGSRVWQYVGSAPDYTIDPEKLLSYKDAVDWALDHDLMVVMDPIHAWKEYSDEDLPMLIKLWEQIAEMFAGYSTDRVAFEIFNEPWSYDFDLKAMLDGCIGVIRDIQGNEERIVIVSGQSFSTRQALIDAFNDNVVFPTDDPFLIGTFHYYDPRPFTNQGDSNLHWADGGDNDPEWMETIDKFQEVVDANNNWAAANNTEPLPIYNGEYGVDNGAPWEDRIRWLWWVRMVSEQFGFSNSIWTLYNDSPESKGLGPWTTLQKNDPTTRYLPQTVMVPYRNRYEAENGVLSNGFEAKSWEGSSDGLVANADNGLQGDRIIVEDVYIARSGVYDLTLRYQQNSSKEDVILLMASGTQSTLIDSVKIKLVPTGGEWWSATVPLTFNTGENNRIQLRLGSPANGLHLDYFAITNGIFYDNLYPAKAAELIYAATQERHFSTLNVYPNPTSDTVFIDGEFGRWELFSRNGRLIRTGSGHIVLLRGMKEGLYILKVDDNLIKIIKH